MESSQSRITNRNSERRWVLAFAAIVMAVTTLPYLFGYAAQTDDWRFTGFVFGVGDGNNYIAKMNSGMAGGWLFYTPYSAYPQRGVVAYEAYILLGKLAAPPGAHEQLAALFHLFRVAAGFAMILATYDFLSLFVENVRWRRWGLSLAVLGGGLGWCLLPWAQRLVELPLEFYSPEAFGFFMVYGYPHLALARALLLWGMVVYLRTLGGDQRGLFDKDGAITGLLWLFLGLLQPLTVVTAWVVVCVHLGLAAVMQFYRRWRSEKPDWDSWRRYARRALWAAAVSSPIVIYTTVAFYSDDFHRAWTQQMTMSSPPVVDYLVAYGLALPFAILGGLRLLREERWRSLLTVAWVLALPFLAYAPHTMQRRLPEGAWVAMAALMMAAFSYLSNTAYKRLSLVLVLMYPSTVILLGLGFLVSAKPSLPVFRPAAEVRAFDWLSANSSAHEVVLASPLTGNALPAWAAVRVMIGHGPESVGESELRPRVAAFYLDGTLSAERQALLDEFNVRYIFYGPLERGLATSQGGEPWLPAVGDGLEIIYQEGEYAIYEVISRR